MTRNAECSLEQCKKIREALEAYEHMINWQVTCKGCADSLDKSYEAYMSEECKRARTELDKALAEVVRLTAIIKGPNWTNLLNLKEGNND